jgi:FkbM family methyltransferase
MSSTESLAFRIQDGIVRFLRGRLAHSVRVKSFLYRILWLMPERFRRTDAVREALKRAGACLGKVRFVNIGANDGLAGDPLREFIVTRGWEGILVEPVPFVFDRLARAYRGRRRVFCENAAIAEENGTLPFWFVRKNDVLPPGYDQVGSFDKAQVLKHETGLFPGLGAFVESLPVTTLTVDGLLAKHGFAGVDVFLIDTEGYDARIVNRIDLARLAPRLIVYENAHVPPAENRACEERLRAAGYRVTSEGGNTLAEKGAAEPAPAAGAGR